MIAPGTHTLTAVSEPKEWSSDYGPMKTYTVKVAGDEGAYDMNKKASSAAPQVGQTIEVAEVKPSSGNFPPKLKLVAPGSGKSGVSMSPEREAKIVRQHSQGVAVEYIKFAHERGTLPDDFKLDNLKVIINWFQADAMEAKP